MKGDKLGWTVGKARGLWWHLVRWGWFYLAILLGHMAKEEYFPFSNWPMYANFSTAPTYVYAVDGHGNEIGWRTTFGQTAAPVKRQYESERDRIQRAQKVDRDTANILGGEVLMERLANRLSADDLEEMGGKLTIYYYSIVLNNQREMEHRRDAVSVIELEPIIAAKRAGEDAAQPDSGDNDEQPMTDETADLESSALPIPSLKEVMA